MQSKKSPKSDLTKNTKLYFAIGLCLMVFVSWRLIEWKTYDKSAIDIDTLNIQDDDDEEVPLTEQLKTPPPPAPEIIEVVEDEEEVEETVIESTETTQEEVIEDVEVLEEDLDVDVPFAIIEDVPLFPGCENVKKSERRKCFQDKIQRHIAKNFRYPEIAQEMGIQGRVHVQFIISKDGSITGIQSRGPDKNLEKEANRIISKLPKMIPGKQRDVLFVCPLVFP